MTFPLIIAILAIVISIISLYISWHQHHRDRYQLHISHQFVTSKQVEGDRRIIKVYNKGRRSVEIMKIYFHLSDNKRLPLDICHDYQVTHRGEDVKIPLRLYESESPCRLVGLT